MTAASRRDFTLENWLAWFESLHPKKIDLSLDRLIAVLDALELRKPTYKVVTVGGTNGKGSCVAMLESIYWHAGYAVGTFTSPHLWRFNERIRFDGADATDAELVDVFRQIDEALGPVTLSYFEASFVAALMLFKRRNADVAILEVGMGGRLDATNTIDTDCALVVSIDLDHREWLGETREAIGYEKAGIMRGGKPVIVGDRTVPQSVLAHAAAVGASARVIGRHFDFVRAPIGGWRRAWDPLDSAPLPLPPFGGDEQYANAASCAEVVAQLQVALPVLDAALAAGIARAYLRGRLERVMREGVEWVFDVGHNPAAAVGLAASLSRLPPARSTYVVFAAMRDKDLAGVVEPLIPGSAAWFVTKASGERGASGDELHALLDLHGVARVHVASDVTGAVEAAHRAAGPGDRVLVYGSFVTVGTAAEALRLYCTPSPSVDRPATWIRA